MTLVEFDHTYHAAGKKHLCGIDEAGRGALAGPVVAAAVILPAGCTIRGVNDSKKLSPAQRERLFTEIENRALAIGIGLASALEVDERNVLQATFLAMKRAVDQLKVKTDYILVDGRDFPQFFSNGTASLIPGEAVIKGDGRSLCIAAASIIAKVYRDRLMCAEAENFPLFGFARHKGYGTLEHRTSIGRNGITPLHRKTFLSNIVQNSLQLDQTEAANA